MYLEDSYFQGQSSDKGKSKKKIIKQIQWRHNTIFSNVGDIQELWHKSNLCIIKLTIVENQAQPTIVCEHTL